MTVLRRALALLWTLTLSSPSSFVTSAFTGLTATTPRGAVFASHRSRRWSHPSSELLEDPYLYLEEVESEESLQFANNANAACLQQLGDPMLSGTGTYDSLLGVLESDDRIPHVGKFGQTEDGEEIMFNFWRDSTNPKGIWRRTTLSSYRTGDPEWATVLDIDKLAEIDGVSWVYKGYSMLQRARDPISNGKRNTRTMISLSRGGADATLEREFDILTEKFVPPEEGGFTLAESKNNVVYKSRDVLLVGMDNGPDSLTDSGYPRTVREWVRGTQVEDAPIVFEGEKTDVSVTSYYNDQRIHNGPIFEIRRRSLTFYEKRVWVRMLDYEHLLAPNDPLRQGVDAPGDFVELEIPLDATVAFLGNSIIIGPRTDWEPIPGTVYKSGSILYTDAETFLAKGKEQSTYRVLFEPTEKTSYRTYSTTKNYLILSISENILSKLLFYKILDNGTLEYVGGDKEAKIESHSCSSVDVYEDDRFWFRKSSYVQPSTLYLADLSKIESDLSKIKPEGGIESCDDLIVEKMRSLPDMYEAAGLTATQKIAISKDGTEVPYFLVAKKDIVLDGNTPTLLYGYGGFQISLGPNYNAMVGKGWLERGGAYVDANIRGGGEFGPAWHKSAIKANKNKSYEDFIAVAEHLIDTNICKPKTLAIEGGSNGGLLMGNMYTMRPDLFGAIHCAVPLLDMKRYHTLLAGASWMAEYGNPDTDDRENFLYKYSPYHNIDPSVKKYPPMLVTTSTRDDRVHPGHARKMVKKLWDMGKDKDWPVFYYENVEGGHGGAANAKQSSFMTSLAYDFMWETLQKGRE
eukprot:scaffold175408_cov62-Attheya_sp.AAC.2